VEFKKFKEFFNRIGNVFIIVIVVLFLAKQTGFWKKNLYLGTLKFYKNFFL